MYRIRSHTSVIIRMYLYSLTTGWVCSDRCSNAVWAMWWNPGWFRHFE